MMTTRSWTRNQSEAIERLLGLDDSLRPVSNTHEYDPDLHRRLRDTVELPRGTQPGVWRCPAERVKPRPHNLLGSQS
jgi:hypothetical protein